MRSYNTGQVEVKEQQKCKPKAQRKHEEIEKARRFNLIDYVNHDEARAIALYDSNYENVESHAKFYITSEAIQTLNRQVKPILSDF